MFALSRFEWLVLAAALLLCPALSWSAEPQAADQEPLFNRLDRNRDGFLSRQELEAPAARQGNWIAVDRDRDGRISRSEFGTIVAQPAQREAPTAAAGGTQPPKKQE